jgi:hypothetical protein
MVLLNYECYMNVEHHLYRLCIYLIVGPQLRSNNSTPAEYVFFNQAIQSGENRE